mgnify:CR=1 FL=1
MKLQIIDPNAIKDKSDIWVIEKGVRHFVNALLSDDAKQNLRVNLYIAELEGGPDSIIAQCIPPKDESAPYTILLPPNHSVSNTVQICAHECVHLAQFVTGQLKVQDRIHYWLGQPFGTTEELFKYDHSQIPWEVEAESKEEELYHSYADWLELQ